MELVVNEWLPEYFRPDASNEEKQLAESFLNTFMQRADCLFVIEPSPFLEKIYKYQKQFDYDVTAREAFKNFISLILKNSDKCRLLTEDEIEDLPEKTEAKLNEGNFSSDKYLFEAASLTDDKIILTTDVKLKKQMEEDGSFHVILLKDFIKDYE